MLAHAASTVQRGRTEEKGATMIVVFDGVCNACNRFVRFLSWRDSAGRLTFVPAQSARGAAMLTACGERPDDPSTMIVVDRGTTLLRSDAVIAAVAQLGGGWRVARLGRIVPQGLRDAAYTGFARRRYRWFGRTADCAVCGAPER
jgi:predicted DCC family thiol-disulfide oxidoreductase YuxK